MVSRKKQTAMRHQRIRKRIAGTAERPRLAVHFSGMHIYAQIIDDEKGCTLTSVSTTEAVLREGSKANIATAQRVGATLAERAKGSKITNVVFDRGGFRYHGKVKALADAAREGGLLF
ncbi:MAG: 50S ribosomal protein L18 [Chthoniobacteraceae bacterium]